MHAKNSKQIVKGHDGPKVKRGDLPISQKERNKHFTAPTFRHYVRYLTYLNTPRFCVRFYIKRFFLDSFTPSPYV